MGDGGGREEFAQVGEHLGDSFDWREEEISKKVVRGDVLGGDGRLHGILG